MKIFKMLICVLLLASTSSQAASLTTKNNSSKAKCSPEEILKFKNEYIKLQNMLKYDAKTLDVKLNKNGKAIADQNKSNSDNNFAEQTEKALYAQYELALSKVGKIYQHLNKAEGLSESDNKFKIDHPEVTNF
ncbi:MAG: hypothetical protein Q7U04_13640, partial [Bacteriovorax sp.]|nr:hypothetical protein [Bacteriovorax sp.]